MPGLFSALPVLLAQKAPPAGGGSATPWVTFAPYAALFVFWFYLIFIRPPQQQEKARRAMISALKKNDKVLTTAGIYGTIFSVDEKDDRIVVQIGDDRGVKVAFTTASIKKVLDSGKEKGSEST